MKKIYIISLIFLSYCLFLQNSLIFAETKQINQVQSQGKDSALEEHDIIKKIRELDIDFLTDYFLGKPAGTVATVNGSPITLSQIENISDMQSYALENNDISFEGVLEEYSIYLFELIVQNLIRQELEKKQITIDYTQVSSIEAIVRRGYSDEDFEEELLSDGINIESWRDQLKARVEHDTFQNYLQTQLVINQEEVKNYINLHKDNIVKPARYKLFLYASSSQEDLQKAYDANMQPHEDTEDTVVVREGTFSLNTLPAEWKEEISLMQIGDKTSIKQIDNEFNYIVLSDIQEQSETNQTQAFLEIEKILINEKLEIAYQEWLKKALSTAEIYIASEFLTILQ